MEMFQCNQRHKKKTHSKPEVVCLCTLWRKILGDNYFINATKKLGWIEDCWLVLKIMDLLYKMKIDGIYNIFNILYLLHIKKIVSDMKNEH